MTHSSGKKMEEGAVIRHDIKKAPKTGDWGYLHPQVDAKKCVGCGACVKYCPEAAIELKEKNNSGGSGKKYAAVDYYFCKGCGVCAKVCPAKAILMKKK